MARDKHWRFTFRLWEDNFDWAEHCAREKRCSIARLLNDLIAEARKKNPKETSQRHHDAPLTTKVQ